MPGVPVVDISANPGTVGADLDEICRTLGFFQVTGGLAGVEPRRHLDAVGSGAPDG